MDGSNPEQQNPDVIESLPAGLEQAIEHSFSEVSETKKARFNSRMNRLADELSLTKSILRRDQVKSNPAEKILFSMAATEAGILNEIVILMARASGGRKPELEGVK